MCRVGKLAASAAVLTLMASMVGCVRYRIVESGWDDLPQDPKPRAAESRLAAGAEGWTVIVRRFTGPRRSAFAHDLLQRLERETSLSGLWIHEGTGAATVYRGRYDHRRDAETALQQVRQTMLAGRMPFHNAVLTALDQRGENFNDPLNIAQYPNRYTLQVGYFDESFDGDRHEAAERVARALREARHHAYYYHGPHNSLVTVGLFDYRQAFVPRPDPRLPSAMIDVYAPHIHELQLQFPYNLANTIDLLESQDETHADAQPSMLVRIY